jgi:hypothetical protein
MTAIIAIIVVTLLFAPLAALVLVAHLAAGCELLRGESPND